jgi:excisionase family DNA binding protein
MGAGAGLIMTNHQTTWMTIREAALALGVSELTVRRRIKDGRLRHQLVNGKYYIDLGSSPTMLESEDGSDDHSELVISRDDQAAPRMIGPTSRKRQSTKTHESLEPDVVQTTGRESDEIRLTPNDYPLRGIDLDALLAEHARLAEAAGRAALLQQQYAELNERHEELRTGMLSLAGRNGWLESKLEERESEIKLLSDHLPRVSWWKRLFRG